jgi:hypothetical protein
MSLKPKPITALLLCLAAGSVYVGASFADPDSVMPGESVMVTPQQTMGILTTQGDNEIIINGANSITGATLLTGANIETLGGVSTVSLGRRGSVEIAPHTKLTLEFDQTRVKVTVTEGCVSLRTKPGTTGEISTLKGATGKTDAAHDGLLETCPSPNATRIAAAEVGSSGLFRLGSAAAVSIIVQGTSAVAVPVAPRGVLY